jgi:hypothetical protein
MTIDSDLTRLDNCFVDLPDFRDNRDFVERVDRCANAAYEAVSPALETFQGIPTATELVSAEALEGILGSNEDRHNISTGIDMRVITLNDPYNPADDPQGRYIALSDERCVEPREQLSELVLASVRRLFDRDDLALQDTGFIIYPPGSHMGWHTNEKDPGWRVFVNVVKEPGRSFFRYRDPVTKEVVTALDTKHNLRATLIPLGEPVWHAIYSDTIRITMAYRVLDPDLLFLLKRKDPAIRVIQ